MLCWKENGAFYQCSFPLKRLRLLFEFARLLNRSDVQYFKIYSMAEEVN